MASRNTAMLVSRHNAKPSMPPGLQAVTMTSHHAARLASCRNDKPPRRQACKSSQCQAATPPGLQSVTMPTPPGLQALTMARLQRIITSLHGRAERQPKKILLPNKRQTSLSRERQGDGS